MSDSRIRALSPAAFAEAAVVIAGGGVVAFPTETYYGLAVDPFSEAALAGLFRVKDRPAVKPILTLIASRAELVRLTPEIPPSFQRLMDHFWPGPLTLIFAARPELPPLLTGGAGTIGIRISSHPVAQQLVRLAGGVITATSANLSGQAPAVSAEEVAASINRGLHLILDGGKTEGGRPSSILAMEAGHPVLLREGMVTADEITRCISNFPFLPH
jgi:L-threonylcarbamoyladenylate synthase